MKKIVGMALLIVSALLNAQSPKDKQNIDKLCGCFDVQFKYAETFSPDPEYKFHERDEISSGIEYIFPVDISEKQLVLQHLLVISDSMIIKHWREDWSFENPVTWVKEQLDPEQMKGKWTQSVWEVSDAPRYQGVSEWIHTDGKIFWQNTTDAPLPRREYSVRNDYNVLRRSNRIIITDSGWIHEQDNQKIIRNGGQDKLLVEEKGINSYKRLDDKYCAVAKSFWEKNKEYWTKVRKVWEDYTATHLVIELKTQVNGRTLHDYLFEQAKDFAAGKIKATEVDSKIRALIEGYIGHDSTGTSAGN
jgi:hypothetical protein